MLWWLTDNCHFLHQTSVKRIHEDLPELNLENLVSVCTLVFINHPELTSYIDVRTFVIFYRTLLSPYSSTFFIDTLWNVTTFSSYVSILQFHLCSTISLMFNNFTYVHPAWYTHIANIFFTKGFTCFCFNSVAPIVHTIPVWGLDVKRSASFFRSTNNSNCDSLMTTVWHHDTRSQYI